MKKFTLMKRITFCFFAFLLLSVSVKSQTEKETIDFLNSKLGLYTCPMGDAPAYFKVSIGEDAGKIVLMNLYVGGDLLSTYKFHCDKINGLTTTRADKGNLCLKLISTGGLILRKFAGEGNETFESMINIPLQTSDEEVNRIKKAFEHLLEINGMVMANDNLFKSK